MITFSLSDLSQETYNNATAVVKDILLSTNANLDLKEGTALADLLVGPSAQILAFNSINNDYVRRRMSFKLLQENPELITDDALDNLASNYNIVRKKGTYATGTVMVKVSSAQEYTIPANYIVALGSLQYTTTQPWKIKKATVNDPLTELLLQRDSEGTLYFLLPMKAIAVGSVYNIAENVSLSVVATGIPNLISVSTYSAFGGGTDTENNEQLLARIPIALSHAEFSSKASISTKLFNEFTNIYDVSVVGMGDPEMLRDKHNVFGVSFGGRVDIYLKTFRQPYTKVILITANKVTDGVYTFKLNATNAPGYYCIRSITSPDSLLTLESNFYIPALGSLPFTESRTGYNLGTTFHDFASDPYSMTRETAYSIWQESTVTVTNVSPVIVNGSPIYPEQLQFKVEVYIPDQLLDIQTYIDDTVITNKESDMVAKSALLAFVSVYANVYRKSSVVLNLNDMKQAVADYINGKTFGEPVTLSQLSAILHNFDIVRVGLDNSTTGMRLEAKVLGTNGIWYTMSGADLDIMSIENPSIGITSRTVIMVADPRSIFLNEKVV